MAWNRSIIFPDFSRYDRDVNGVEVAMNQAPVVFIRASDAYFLPDRDGVYHYPLVDSNPLATHTDAYYRSNTQNIEEAGLPTVPYHYVRFNLDQLGRPPTVQKNLEYFMQATQGLVDTNQTRWIVLDLEQPNSQLFNAGLDSVSVSNLADQLVQTFREHYKVMVYTNQSWGNRWLTHTNLVQSCPLWVANYKPLINNRPSPSAAPRIPNLWENQQHNVLFWQYTDDGAYNGTSRPTSSSGHDLNFMKFDSISKLYDFLGVEIISPPADCREEVISELQMQVIHLQNRIAQLQE